MTYFKRMSDIEGRFYEIWKDMSLNDSLSPVERSKLAVWDYPVSDKYTKMWQAMQEAGLPNSLEEAVARVRNSTSATGNIMSPQLNRKCVNPRLKKQKDLLFLETQLISVIKFLRTVICKLLAKSFRENHMQLPFSKVPL